MPFEVPEDLGELLRDPARIRKAFEMLRALENLTVRDPDGVRRPIRFSPHNATIDLGPTGAEATTGTEEAPLHPETIVWRDRAIAGGGTFGPSSIATADALIRAINDRSYNLKVTYLLPLLGANLATAKVPLRLKSGLDPTVNNNGFLEADFAENSGLTADGIAKWWELQTLMGEQGTADVGGVGYWERGTPGDEWPVATRGNANRDYGLRIRSTSGSEREAVSWGSDNVTLISTPGANHYYGQSSSASDLRLYKDGIEIGSNTTPRNTSDINDRNIGLFRKNGTANYQSGRCGVMYLTDGTLSPSDIADLHSLLNTYLIAPTGR